MPFTTQSTEGPNNVKYRHGLWGTRLHMIWCRMNQRCHNPKCGDYRYYGAKGIQVCQRWRDSFALFRDDVGDPADGMTLDRWPNKEGNYEPGNVRWASRKQQSDNSSIPKTVEFNGMKMNYSEWARFYGVGRSAIPQRVARGMTPLQAVSTPFRSKQ